MSYLFLAISWVRWVCKNEPVRVLHVIYALLILLVVFHFKNLTTDQISAIIGVVAAVLGVSSEVVRSQVTPNIKL